MPDNQYEILALTLRYWFVLLVIYTFVRSFLSTLRRLICSNSLYIESTGNIPFILVLFAISAMILLSLKDDINLLIMVWEFSFRQHFCFSISLSVISLPVLINIYS